MSFYHACLGFPVKQMWLDTIKAGNCNTFGGLTYSNMARHCPNTNETNLGHLAQQRQNVRSTKAKLPTPLSPPALPTTAPSPADVPSIQVFITVHPLSRLYTDDTGRFSVRACLGNQYIMIPYADGNLILQQAFKSKSDHHCIAAYNAIMIRLTARGLLVDLWILDNKTSAAYKEAITFKWNAKSNLSHQICIPKTKLNALFARSRNISWQYWLALTQHFPRTFGTFFCHRLNSPSIFPVKPHSIQGLVHGNYSKVSSTSTRHNLGRLVVASSSMQSWLLGIRGISVQNQVSILALP
jgi:hypothetical protein